MCFLLILLLVILLVPAVGHGLVVFALFLAIIALAAWPAYKLAVRSEERSERIADAQGVPMGQYYKARNLRTPPGSPFPGPLAWWEQEQARRAALVSRERVDAYIDTIDIPSLRRTTDG